MNNIYLINFIDLTLEEKKLVLSWRNHPNIRKWMYDQEKIQLKNHLNFIDNLNNTKDKKYFLVKNDKQYLGVIDFNNISKKSLVMGLYKNPNAYNVGNILLDTIIDYSFHILKVDTIVSEVFESNVKAQQLYLSLGFNVSNNKIVNNKKVIVMELKNENR